MKHLHLILLFLPLLSFGQGDKTTIQHDIREVEIDWGDLYDSSWNTPRLDTIYHIKVSKWDFKHLTDTTDVMNVPKIYFVRKGVSSPRLTTIFCF
ncbi:MAG: hypothetical protein IH948_07455 [Bacteroidetes bacterium]|nr:hypothetical protein [Bacteroidota bacterium]